MSFAKAEQLLDLATMVSARKQGVTLNEVCDKFEISLRTAQRMLHTLESRFPEVDTVSGDDGRKRWRMPGGTVRDLVHITADELASLDLGVAHLKRGGLHVEAKAVEALREKIIAMIPRQRIARLETDYDAILEAQGFVARSGVCGTCKVKILSGQTRNIETPLDEVNAGEILLCCCVPETEIQIDL